MRLYEEIIEKQKEGDVVLYKSGIFVYAIRISQKRQEFR